MDSVPDVEAAHTTSDARPSSVDALSNTVLQRVATGASTSSSFKSGFRSFRKPSKMQQSLPNNCKDWSVFPNPPAPTVPKDAVPHSSSCGFRAFKRPKRDEEVSTPVLVPSLTTPITNMAGGSQEFPVVLHSGSGSTAHVDSVGEVTDAMAFLKSPSKQSYKLLSSTSSAPIVPLPFPGYNVVPFISDLIHLGNGTVFTASEFSAVKLEQRNSMNLYSTPFFFPAAPLGNSGGNLTDTVRSERTSLRRAQRYICLGTYGCKVGDFLKVLQDSDVLLIRNRTMQRRMSPAGKSITWSQYMVEELQGCWNRTTESWESISVALGWWSRRSRTVIFLWPRRASMMAVARPAGPPSTTTVEGGGGTRAGERR